MKGMESRRMGGGGRARCTYGKLRQRGEGNIEMDLQEIIFGSVD